MRRRPASLIAAGAVRHIIRPFVTHESTGDGVPILFGASMSITLRILCGYGGRRSGRSGRSGSSSPARWSLLVRGLVIACGILPGLAFHHGAASETSSFAEPCRDHASSGAAVSLSGGSLLVPSREAAILGSAFKSTPGRVLPVGPLTLTVDSVTRFAPQSEPQEGIASVSWDCPSFAKR